MTSFHSALLQITMKLKELHLNSFIGQSRVAFP